MTPAREPILKPVAIDDLRPTQITVGMREVEAKRAAWRAKAGDDAKPGKASEFLGQHMIPVIVGPKGHHYVTDHHHLALALHKEGVEHVLVTVVADLQRLPPDSFWFVLDNRGWMHPYDDKGRRRDADSIPKSVTGLVDDPYRSLAGELRQVGGYAKDTTPFSEFLWADFLRSRIDHKLLDQQFNEALKQAMQLSKGEEADYLPGWCGTVAR